MLQADIDELNKLVTTLKDVATQVDGIVVRTTGDQITAALPGCTIGPACAQLGEFTEGAWFRVAERVRALSDLVYKSANLFAANDEQFRLMLDQMDFHTRGDR
ncbi:hypothetical protein [Nocardia veterana]|uniref:Excreted virulence factor EspC (Type VII ESX diderm) n=1 Tax=Nocardia veterana TaxID=132249 RepID=A0A7X6LWA2_9NOCA|nr:hypothetical protein [Nocardia veterana]NKY85683.1 hypothetical protein [Nocardia veterana]